MHNFSFSNHPTTNPPTWSPTWSHNRNICKQDFRFKDNFSVFPQSDRVKRGRLGVRRSSASQPQRGQHTKSQHCALCLLPFKKFLVEVGCSGLGWLSPIIVFSLTLYTMGGGLKVPGQISFCDYYIFIVGNMPLNFLTFLKHQRKKFGEI